MRTVILRLTLFVIILSSCTLPSTATFTPGEVSTTPPAKPLSFKPLSEDSVVMLIGDLSDNGPKTPWLSTLKSRIDVAAKSGVDTIVLDARTSSIENSYEELDLLLNQAANKGISVIPRITVNSSTFSELIRTTAGPQPDLLPAYTNAAQLQYATELLQKIIRHIDSFPNVVGYQIEWGHWGESWINAPFWDSPSSKEAFLKYIHGLSPQFERFNENNLASWMSGEAMFYGPCLPAGDVRRDPLNVAEFNWYQEWRNNISREIVWHFRSAAQAITKKPIIGFSYVVAGNGVIGYTYNADKYLDMAYSDWPPEPLYYQMVFIRDAYFTGLHLGEFDFDTPYFAKERAEQGVKDMYARGIIPVIFYPQHSTELSDRDIPKLVEYINKYKGDKGMVNQAQVLVVFGHNDVGWTNLDDTTPLAAEGGAPLTAPNPPGLLAAMLSKGITVDAMNPDVYTASIGDRYKVVLVVVPRDTIEHQFQELLNQTSTNVIIAQPSFLFGTPTQSSPTTVTSAYCGMWNPLVIKGRTVKIQVYGGTPNPQIEFQGPYTSFGTINNYTPHHLFSYYDGNFDEVYAIAHFPNASYPTIGRIDNIVLFGLDTHLEDDDQREISQSAFLNMLEMMGVKSGQ
jgi:hypothetical protein